MDDLTGSLNIQFKFWILQTIAFMITCFLLPRLTVRGPFSAFLAVLVLAFVNAHFWNAAFFYHIPNTFATGTLILVGVNAVIFFLVMKILPGIEIYGLFPAIAAPIVFSVVSMLVTFYGQNVSFTEIEGALGKLLGRVESNIGTKIGR